MATSAELGSAFNDIDHDVDGELENGGAVGRHPVFDEFREDLGAFEPELAERRAPPPSPGREPADIEFRAPVPAPSSEEPRQWMLIVALAVGLVATGVGAAGAWVSMQPGGLPILPSAPAPWMSAEESALPRIVMPDAPAAPVSAVAPLEAVLTASFAPVSPAAVGAPPAGGAARAAVDATLVNVSLAYRALDASALLRDWPGADVAKLSDEFGALKYQSLSFDRCEVRPAAAAQVVASCAVSRALAPKSGDQTLQRAQETWTIVLSRLGERYVIGGVTVR